MDIEAIINQCGGGLKISEEALRRAASERNPANKRKQTITYKGVRRWVKNGIPAHWFSLVISLSGCTANDIHNANKEVFEKKTRTLEAA